MASLRGDENQEALLVVKARQGDDLAWEKLMGAYQQAVFRLAYLITGDSDAAEDVTQETFIRAHRALDRFDESRPLKPWLFQIAANQSRNWRRSLGRYFGALGRLAQQQETFDRDAESQVVERTQSQQVWQAIRRLPARDQEIIYYRHFLGLTVAETAQTLDVAEGTVKSRLARALDHLREVILEDFPALNSASSGIIGRSDPPDG